MSTVISTCKTCPLYVKTADVKEATGLPYFAMCGGSGRFINESAAKTLPGSDHCPARSTVDGDTFTVTKESAEARIAMRGVVDLGASIPTRDTVIVAHPRATDATAESVQPSSCRKCIFFTAKTEGATAFPGTPAARYDSCVKYGTLIMPTTHAATALLCDGGIDRTAAPAGEAKASDLRLYPIYTSAATAATTTERPTMPTPADAAATITEDALAALLRGDVPTMPTMHRVTAPDESAPALDLSALLGLGDALDGKPEPTLEDFTEAITPAKSDGRKALPKRPQTGAVFSADKFDLSAHEPLPEGAYGVVAVRSTSRASDVIFLPRYAADAFPEGIALDVPAEDENAYLDHNDVLFRMAASYAADSVAALWGDAGVGKTEGVEQIARLTRQPFCRISIKWATQVDDLTGRWTLNDGTMEWLEGRFTKAWRAAYVVCVDEPNTGKDEVWQALRAPFDGAKILVLDEKDGERIPRHAGCRVFTAMNPSWDARFTGTQPLNDADLDRMEHIVVPYPPQDVERAILAAKAPHLTAEQVDAMLNVARDVRAAVQANTIRISFGVRKMLRWAGCMKYMSPLAAYKQSVSAWMEPGQARLLDDLCDAYFRS